MYFRYGMNDILPKPFTKEGMLRALEKNLPQFRKNTTSFPNQAQMAQPGGFITQNHTQTPLGLNMGQLSAPQSMKDETSPAKSPVTTSSSWHSPNQIPSTSPVTSIPGNYGTYSLNASHAQQSGGYHPPNTAIGSSAPRVGGPHRRVMSDMTGGPIPEEHPDFKRQRMYQAPPGNFQ